MKYEFEIVETIWNDIAFINVINDVDTKKIFAFVKKHPAVCAQADNVEDAKIKIDKFFKRYMDCINGINGAMV